MVSTVIDECVEGAELDAMESILRRLYNDLGARRQGMLLSCCACQLLLPVPAAAAFPLWAPSQKGALSQVKEDLLDSVGV